MSHYLKVEWRHSLPDEPVLLYSELDEDRWEIRKIEVFRDGDVGYASRSGSEGPNRHSGQTKLGQVPMPPFEEIEQDLQFKPFIISVEEFESAWTSALEYYNRRLE